jgi:hypothetical protein
MAETTTPWKKRQKEKIDGNNALAPRDDYLSRP